MKAILVYGADWCGDCWRTKHFLDAHSIPYQWIDIETDLAADETVRKVNNGRRIIPTLILEDGSTLVEPTDMELARKFNIREGR
jgi:mycoredoxin